MGTLNGKVIIVTGGTSGIGEACSELFASDGASVVAASIQQDEGRALEERLRGRGLSFRFFESDVRDEDKVKALAAYTLQEFGRIDAVHSNAGILRTGAITDFSVADFHLIFDVNVLGAALLVKHIIPVMVEQGEGVFCFTTSVASEIGFPEHELYGASKAALGALIRSLTTDYGSKGLRFVGVSPGTIDTPMLSASVAGWSESREVLYARVAAKIPVRRLGTPEDVAKAVRFLFSDDGSYIAGSIIYLEGGTMALPPW
ncbi:MAG TPA: SDR family oxidoreductase [Spirochaetia bacterium]|nr:SDR family oxidoreductase [Spirochaetia bacterium]